MPGRLAALWEYVADYLSTALWFIPALLTVAAVMLAYVALAFGTVIDASTNGDVWWLHGGDGGDASALLGTLLSSVITVTALVVSIMMVVLTLAANQLGPRLIRIFVGDRRTQAALGVFIATIAYLLVVLRTLDHTLSADQVPHVAVTLGSLLSLTCIGVLLFFVHHLSRAIVADTVIHTVGLEVDAALRAMKTADTVDDVHDQPPPANNGRATSLKRGGYVQIVDTGQLVSCAREAGAVLELYFRPGDHLLPGQPHLRVFPAAALDDAFHDRICAATILGDQRTAPQDVGFGLRQLVEIALRALSPGMNDPFTAITVLDRMAQCLAIAMDRPPPPRVLRDEDGSARVFARPVTFEDLTAIAFDQIREAAAGKAAILNHIQNVLARLAWHARTDDHRAILRRHADRTAALARRSIMDADDRAALEDSHLRVLRNLSSPR